MNKFGFLGVFAVVCLAHVFILNSYIKSPVVVSKPEKKVHKITLSSVIVKKPAPPPPPKPVILPPKKPKPIVKPKPKSKPKKVVKKITKKPKIKKPPKIVQKPFPKVLKREIVQTVAPKEEIDTTSIRDKYTTHIREEIRKNLLYPKMAKRLRLEDKVLVKFMVSRDGTVSNIRVINKPRKLLSNGAKQTLKLIKLKPMPTELIDRVLYITIPIEFKLKG